MRKRLSPAPFVVSLALGLILFVLTGMRSVSDAAFCLGSGALVIGLVRLLSNMKMFASFSWGTRMLKRVFQGRARSGREEAEDYAKYRASLGGHADAPVLLAAALVLILVSLALSGL